MAGPYVRAACQRHINDLKRQQSPDWPFRYCQDGAASGIRFFEEYLKLNGGQFEGLPFLLLPWQAFVVGSIFGWKRKSDGMRRFRVVYVETAKGPLALDTPIATPTGWTTMGEIRPGDMVFNSAGKPTAVIGVSPIFYDRPCYRLRFSDGAEITADSEHEWFVSSLRNGKRPGPRNDAKRGEYEKRNTEYISKTFRMNDSKSIYPQAKWNHRVDVAPALDLPDRDLPLPPYSLGAWLGDGNSDDARLTVAYSDWQIVDEIKSEGTQAQERARHSRTTARIVLGGNRTHAARTKSFQAKLRKLDLLKNKHIPFEYFRAGTKQRLALLRGIMDTDGHIGKNGHCEISLCNERLSLDVAELLRGLGYKCAVRESDAKLTGRVVGRRWRICFQAYRSQPPVLLYRKTANLSDEPQTRPLSRGRMIVGCEPVKSVPVRCITVASDDHMFLAGNHLVPTCNSGKTPLSSGVGLKGLCADAEPRAEVYAAATFKEQAMVLFRDAVAFYDQSPELQSRLVASGVGDKRWKLAYPKNGSFFRVISSEKKGQSGPRPHIALFDEVHEHTDGTVIEMVRAGFKFRRQPLSFMITNSGYDKSSVCWEYHEMGRRVSEEEIVNDEFFAYICALDDSDLENDQFLENESCWIKVNPSLDAGIPGYDYIRGQVAEARGMPSKMATVKRLCFCVWTESENPAISREHWVGCEDKDFHESILSGRKCWGGLDLSAVNDLTSFGLLFSPSEDDPLWRLKVWFWVPEKGLRRKEEVDHVPYLAWRDAGYLFTSPGEAISKGQVIRFISEEAAKYDPAGIAYDRNRMKDLMEIAEKEGIDLDIGKWDKDKHRWIFSGVGIRMMPFGQEARSMTPAIDKFETALLQRTFRHDGNPALTRCASNVVVESDGDYRRYSKKKSIARIDGIIVTAMCFGISDDSERKSVYDGLTKEEIIRRISGK